MIVVDTKSFFTKSVLRLLLVGSAVITIAWTSPLWAAATGVNSSRGSDSPDREKEFGIKVVSLRPTAGGQMLDLRFRVIDSEKAKAVLDKNKKAYLLDSNTGKTLPVPVSKVGPMRQTTLQPEAGRIYFMLFSNPGGLVMEGGRVSLVIGDYRKDGIIVDASGAQPSSTKRPSPQQEAAPGK